ncbi:MAG: NAD-dependent malic enzyme [Deltaproteobacteria bacterium]|jgi:malate dehydrogenase (oxaloacetate-decarboxylating)|nr:NAD-dependent malic enzyme [Deltaproteobacteria bacterium]
MTLLNEEKRPLDDKSDYEEPSQHPHDEDWNYAALSLPISRSITQDPNQAYKLTSSWRNVALVTDGSNVPGLGDAGPLAAMPLIERKGKLLTKLAQITPIPLILANKSPEEAVSALSALRLSFGAVNLVGMNEATAMEVKRRLTENVDTPVFLDNQDGLPILCLAALLNAAVVVNKKVSELKLVILGDENEALPIVDFLHLTGLIEILVVDRSGIIHVGRPGPTNWIKEELAQKTNPSQVKGPLSKALNQADVLIALSNILSVTKDLIAQMAAEPIVFDLADLNLERLEKKGVFAAVKGPGPNLLSSALVFPGLLRGVLEAKARVLNAPMKMAAALALAKLVPEAELAADFILPKVDKANLVASMAEAVSVAATASGAGRMVIF